MQMLELESPVGEWTPTRDRVDPAGFVGARLGPHRLGRRVRVTALGEVAIALHDQLEEVLEIELLDAASRTPLAGPEGTLLADVAHVVGLRHRHVAAVIGAGIESGTPYLVRQHHLGRTLEQVVDEVGGLPEELGPAILFSVAEAASFLAEQGPQAGVCCLGGFGPGEVFLGFDGTVLLFGAGLWRLRCPDGDPVEEDMESCQQLACFLDRVAGAPLEKILRGTTDPKAVALTMRRRYRDACGARAERLGTFLRAHYGDIIATERAFFGMPTLH